MSRYGSRIAALERRARRERVAIGGDTCRHSDGDDSSGGGDDGSSGRRNDGSSSGNDDDSPYGGEDDNPSSGGEAPSGPDNPEKYLREGAGRAIWLYVEGRTGGRMVSFSSAELEALERAMNWWLECYTRCYGVELEAAFTVREAADLLVQTRNIDDVGQLLTGVPARTA